MFLKPDICSLHCLGFLHLPLIYCHPFSICFILIYSDSYCKKDKFFSTKISQQIYFLFNYPKTLKVVGEHLCCCIICYSCFPMFCLCCFCVVWERVAVCGHALHFCQVKHWVTERPKFQLRWWATVKAVGLLWAQPHLH